MNVFKFELRLKRKSFIIWTGSLSLLLLLFFIEFPSFKDSMGDLMKMFDAFPSWFLKAFGVDLNIFSSYIGFLAYAIMYIILAASIFSMQNGLLISSYEKTIGMSDFLLTKPMSRTSILLYKYLAAFVKSLMLTVVLFIAAYLSNMILDGSYVKELMYMFLSLLLIQIFFINFGTFLSSLMSKNKSIISLSIIIVFSFYIITMIERVLDYKFLELISPFSHLDASSIVLKRGFDTKLLILNIALSIIFFIVSIIIYNRENVRK